MNKPYFSENAFKSYTNFCLNIIFYSRAHLKWKCMVGKTNEYYSRQVTKKYDKFFNFVGYTFNYFTCA